MKLNNFRKLKEIMARTFSDNDHESLASIRAANKLLSAENPPLSWAKVLDRSVRVEVPFEAADGAEADDSTEALFDAALEGANGSFRDMLEDIYGQWQRTHRLSPRQREVVSEAAERARGLR